jgi:hypothetical protein
MCLALPDAHRLAGRRCWLPSITFRCDEARSLRSFVMAPTSPDSDLVDIAVLSRGPMDGREHSIDGDTDELCVVMTDGQQHRYTRTGDVQALPDGRLALVFDWAGRYYGPKE